MIPNLPPTIEKPEGDLHLRVAFLGTGEIGEPSLRALASWSGAQIVAVFSQPDRPAGRDLKLRPSPIKVAAAALGLPVFQPEKIRALDPVEQLRSLDLDFIVVVAYGQILPRAVLDLPRLGCLNIHASLLPRHRGASPIQAAILAGDTSSGVTIMHMAEGLDTGDVILKKTLALGRRETGGGLHDRLAALAPAALLEVLELIRNGTAPREAQEESLATYAPKMSREDGRIDWSQSAEEIDRRIRAFSPWPGTFTELPPTGLLKIHRAALHRRGRGDAGVVLRADSRGILVGTGRGAILLREIQAAGGKRLTVAEFLRGHPMAAGLRLG